MSDKIIKGVLLDQYGGDSELGITAILEGGQLLIKVKGYGDNCSNDGDGVPILIEQVEGRLKVVVWSDINAEDPTHVISMEEAREDVRIEN